MDSEAYSDSDAALYRNGRSQNAMNAGTPEEVVVLVDEDNKVLGTVPKSSVHTAATPLHRAFFPVLIRPQGAPLAPAAEP